MQRSTGGRVKQQLSRRRKAFTFDEAESDGDFHSRQKKEKQAHVETAINDSLHDPRTVRSPVNLQKPRPEFRSPRQVPAGRQSARYDENREEKKLEGKVYRDSLNAPERESPTSTSNVYNNQFQSSEVDISKDESSSVVHTGDDESMIEDEDGVMVFQCKQCNTIIGDSLTWVSDDCNLNSFTLKKVSASVKAARKLTTSSSKYDFGSTFDNLVCASCETVIGRVYKTTPTHLDDIRHMPTILAHSVKCYRIGGGDILPGGDGEWIGHVPSMKELLFELEKTQTIVVEMNNRLTALESQLNGPVV